MKKWNSYYRNTKSNLEIGFLFTYDIETLFRSLIIFLCKINHIQLYIQNFRIFIVLKNIYII